MWRFAIVSYSYNLKATINSDLVINFDVCIFSCWMSVDKGTIFGFVVPMLAIILVSLVCVSIDKLWCESRVSQSSS